MCFVTAIPFKIACKLNIALFLQKNFFWIARRFFRKSIFSLWSCERIFNPKYCFIWCFKTKNFWKMIVFLFGVVVLTITVNAKQNFNASQRQIAEIRRFYWDDSSIGGSTLELSGNSLTDDSYSCVGWEIFFSSTWFCLNLM